jgi:hypothetical protein
LKLRKTLKEKEEGWTDYQSYPKRQRVAYAGYEEDYEEETWGEWDAWAEDGYEYEHGHGTEQRVAAIETKGYQGKGYKGKGKGKGGNGTGKGKGQGGKGTGGKGKGKGGKSSDGWPTKDGWTKYGQMRCRVCESGDHVDPKECYWAAELDEEAYGPRPSYIDINDKDALSAKRSENITKYGKGRSA